MINDKKVLFSGMQATGNLTLGNYLDMNLGMANYLAKKYLDEVLIDIKPERLVYPE